MRRTPFPTTTDSNDVKMLSFGLALILKQLNILYYFIRDLFMHRIIGGDIIITGTS